jgi:two-component system cell cycle response regulator
VRPSPRVLLIDSNQAGRAVLAERLRLQGFLVIESGDGAEGAVRALEEPPSAVVADLTMPSISGVQLCRLLRSEAGTANVTVVLRGPEGRRNHFWAEQAGASAYVIKGRMGELVRALRRGIERAQAEDGDFFVVSSTEGLDVRERIATHLDAALFESVIAAEVRRLGTSESFDRLVDLLSQFVSQVTTYRWMSVLRTAPPRFGIHVNPTRRDHAIEEARVALAFDAAVPIVHVEDEDAATDEEGPPPVVFPIHFGEQTLGYFALAPCAPAHAKDPVLARTIAQELGGALRMASLVEESRRMATTDSLTGLLNRRALLELASQELRRATRYHDALAVILLDIDHFKHINDDRGHASGDAVLAAVARLLGSAVRSCDIIARWGGEEFVVTLPSTSLAGARDLAERLRKTLESANILDTDGDRVPVTASFGVAALGKDDTLEQLVDRADRAMYTAKSAGRNRVHICELPAPAAAPPATNPAAASAAKTDSTIPPSLRAS